MTRKRLKQILFRIFLLFLFILTGALLAKFSGDRNLELIYDFINDMSLILVTVVAVYMTNVFHKRTQFLTSLREEWRDIVDTKAVLLAYCSHQNTTHEDYIIAFRKLSRTVDYMRIVYRNVGETEKYIGHYPYAPLHNMLEVMSTLNPRDNSGLKFEAKVRARKEIIALFDALREHFLDEFDLSEPTRPLIRHGARRHKIPGP